MEDVLREANNLSSKGEPFVIATVIGTKGSTPQKPGAKLLVRQDGSGVGTLGGGCVEGDIWFAAKMLLSEGGDSTVTDYMLNEDIAAREGLVCGGTMYFLIDPIRDHSSFETKVNKIVDAYDGGESVGQATLLKTVDSKGKIGDKILLEKDGSYSGTLGHKNRDKEAIKTLKNLMDYGRVEYLKTQDGAEIFLEGFTTPASVVIAGGGHISKSVAPLVTMLGLRLYVVDDRPEFANKERFPEAEGVIVAEYHEGLTQIDIRPNTAVIVATRGHREDDLALEAAARSPAGYVGLVGSRRKTILIYEELLKNGISLDRIKAIHAPVGLDIGAKTPEEIAVSIMSEIVAFREGKPGKSLTLEDRYIRKIANKLSANLVAS
ncbi:MAG: XdhC family protein [SAR202 cluster bacterium]|nr:XdhC family protein [SAR202 cluster bacterium]|tara:strand:- start:2843 stop:3973 length:1131 start_codon:yes stop_codon:yes gene_type:complete